MRGQPLVSIIIPCFNTARFLGDSIRSALNQTYPHKEVIVIDDGSTDGSLEIIQSFGDSVRWQVSPHRGGSAARNAGLALARGDLIQFHDADDLLHAEKLTRQVPVVVREGAELVYCDYRVIDEAGHPLVEGGSRAPAYHGEDPVEFTLLQGGISTSAPLHSRKSLVAIGGFREALTCAQERDLHVRLACHGAGLFHLPEELVTIRRVRGSVSDDRERMIDQHCDIVQCARAMLLSAGRLTDARRAAMAGLLALGARTYLKAGCRGKARDYFRTARDLHAEGGIPQAYAGPARLVCRVLGPEFTHRIVGWKRSLLPC